jgi:hypothetical protein
MYAVAEADLHDTALLQHTTRPCYTGFNQYGLRTGPHTHFGISQFHIVLHWLVLYDASTNEVKQLEIKSITFWNYKNPYSSL